MKRDVERVIVYRGNPGLVAGIFGCGFAVLGIFTIGPIFVPLAALCSVVGLLRGAVYWNIAGFATSLLAVILVFLGLASSPSLLIALGVLFAPR